MPSRGVTLSRRVLRVGNIDGVHHDLGSAHETGVQCVPHRMASGRSVSLLVLSGYGAKLWRQAVVPGCSMRLWCLVVA